MSRKKSKQVRKAAVIERMKEIKKNSQHLLKMGEPFFSSFKHKDRLLTDWFDEVLETKLNIPESTDDELMPDKLYNGYFLRDFHNDEEDNFLPDEAYE